MVEKMDPAHLLRLFRANAKEITGYEARDLLPVIDGEVVEHQTTYVPRKDT